MSQSCFVIAEAGVNHNGDRDLALRLVDAAADAGADAVKFQTFRAEEIVSLSAPKAAYQIEQTGEAESQYEMLKALELGPELHQDLADHCRARDIQFLSTPFDLPSLEFLVKEIGVERLKIPSGEITNGPLILASARTGLPIILSTGMSTLGEVEIALGAIAYGYSDDSGIPSFGHFRDKLAAADTQALMQTRVAILHCTSDYPAAYSDVNLRAMDTLSAAFGLPVGYSDHTLGTAVSIGAVARGARVIEKHFTLDRTLPGPDHAASLEPNELTDMVAGIRAIEDAIGNSQKRPVAREIDTRTIARKRIIARRSIRKGETLTPDNLAVKRPGDGLSPMMYWQMLGRPANRDYEVEEPLDQ